MILEDCQVERRPEDTGQILMQREQRRPRAKGAQAPCHSLLWSGTSHLPSVGVLREAALIARKAKETHLLKPFRSCYKCLSIFDKSASLQQNRNTEFRRESTDAPTQQSPHGQNIPCPPTTPTQAAIPPPTIARQPPPKQTSTTSPATSPPSSTPPSPPQW